MSRVQKTRGETQDSLTGGVLSGHVDHGTGSDFSSGNILDDLAQGR